MSQHPGADLPDVVDHRPGCAAAPGEPAQPRSTRGRARALVLLGVHALIAARIAHWLQAGRTLTPLEPSEAATALASKVVDAGVIFFLLTILTTLVVGRFFCGWACHLVALQDGSRWLLRRFGIRPRELRSRTLAFAPFVCAALMFLWPLVERHLAGAVPGAWRAEFTTADFWSRFPGPLIAGATFAVCGFASVWLLGSKGFCSYGCPYGAIYGLADRFARGRIRVDPDACESCGHCTAVCTSGVVVHREVARFGQVVDPGCMKCLDCVSACPKDALRFGFGEARPGAASTGATSRGRTDLSRGEEVLAALVFVAALASLFKSYALVPLLLATMLAVLVALAAVLSWRLCRSNDLRLQGWTLRRAGSWTWRGRTALAVCAAMLAGTVHTGLVHASQALGQRALRSAAAQASDDSRRDSLERARTALEREERLGLVRRTGLSNELGQVYAELGQTALAITSLRRAIDESPEALAPRRKLVEVLERSERLEDLAPALWSLLERAPLDRAGALELGGSGLLQRLVSAAPEALEPRLLVIEVQRLLGDLESARENLENAAARFPTDGRIERMRTRLDSR